MKIPNAHLAVVELSKLTNYCLDPSHPRGRRKARVFAARLGWDLNDAGQLRFELLSAILRADDATRGKVDGFGARYTLDFYLSTVRGTALIRSSWIVRTGEGFPRFVTCYIR